MAVAYAGNRGRFDVLDFRGGISCQKFSSSTTIIDIAEKVGGVVVKNTNDFTKAMDLLKHVPHVKEYSFTCGKHAAIIRKTVVAYKYLELQSPTKNGFNFLTTDKLKLRFGAKKSHILSGMKYQTKDCIIDIEFAQKRCFVPRIVRIYQHTEGQTKEMADRFHEVIIRSDP